MVYTCIFKKNMLFHVVLEGNTSTWFLYTVGEYNSFNFGLQICLQIQLTTDYITIDKMSYIFLLKLKNFAFMGYSSKTLKFRFSLKWFEENSIIPVVWIWMRLFLTKITALFV